MPTECAAAADSLDALPIHAPMELEQRSLPKELVLVVSAHDEREHAETLRNGVVVERDHDIARRINPLCPFPIGLPRLALDVGVDVDVEEERRALRRDEPLRRCVQLRDRRERSLRRESVAKLLDVDGVGARIAGLLRCVEHVKELLGVGPEIEAFALGAIKAALGMGQSSASIAGPEAIEQDRAPTRRKASGSHQEARAAQH